MTRICLSQSIRGPLQNWDDIDWRKATKWMTHQDGTPFKGGAELRALFLQMLSEGKEVVPYGECDNFDFKKGCLGHDD